MSIYTVNQVFFVHMLYTQKNPHVFANHLKKYNFNIYCSLEEK